MEQLDCVYLSNIPFHQDTLHRPISAMSYTYHCSYGTHNAYKLISNTCNFILQWLLGANKAISVH